MYIIHPHVTELNNCISFLIDTFFPKGPKFPESFPIFWKLSAVDEKLSAVDEKLSAVDEGRLQIKFYWSGRSRRGRNTGGCRRYKRKFSSKIWKNSLGIFQIFLEISCFWSGPYLPITFPADHSCEYRVFCNFHSNEYIQKPKSVFYPETNILSENLGRLWNWLIWEIELLSWYFLMKQF